MNIVVYDCGCIGFPEITRDTDGHTLIIKDCCGEPSDPNCGNLNLFWRDMSDKKIKKCLTDEEEEKMIREIDTLMYEGYQLRNIRSILKG